MSNRAPRTEADEFGAFARRILRAYGRRVADRDIEALAGLVELRGEVDAAIDTAIDGLVASGDYSFTDIGRVLGISRQAAQQRHARRRPGQLAGALAQLDGYRGPYSHR